MTNQMLPISALETQAAAQRRQLHNDVTELRTRVRHRLEPKRVAREYVIPATGAAALVGLLLGYGMAGIFVD